jgi:hypothetical protein
LFGGVRVALLDGRQDAGDFAHGVQDNRLQADRQRIDAGPASISVTVYGLAAGLPRLTGRFLFTKQSF